MLIALHVLIAVHITHWLVAGKTLAPLELNEVVYTVELGIVTAGFLFMAAAVAATALVGRFFCSWGCHMLALQDLSAWLLKKVGVKPRAIRSRALLLTPFAVSAYMFVWPVAARLWTREAAPRLHTRTDAQGWASFVTEDFWRNLPGPWITLLMFLVCGGLVIYVLGSRGFCSSVCPYGAIFRVADKTAPGRIRLVKDCENCGLCTAVCSSHVRVGEELQRYGMVVDSACLKDLDCVGVCPEGAVRFGFGRWGWGAPVRSDARVRGAFDFSWLEEVVTACVILTGVLIYRGLYGRVPFFLSLAFGVILACMAVAGLRLAIRPDARFNRWPLKTAGRMRCTGIVFAVALACVAVVTVHSGFVRYHAWRGQHMVSSLSTGPERADPAALLSTADTIDSALHHMELADTWGLLDTPGVRPSLARLHFAAATIALGAGRRADAVAHLRAGLQFEADSVPGHLELGALLMDQGQGLAGIRHLERAAELAPRSAEAHFNLAVALAMTGQSGAQKHLDEAFRLKPDDPQISAFRSEYGRGRQDPGLRPGTEPSATPLP